MRKNTLIIGASSGLGRELAIEYAKNGANVGLVGRRANKLSEIKTLYPDRVSILQGNINEANIPEKILALIKYMNGIDILIITASIIDSNPNLEVQSELSVINTNVSGYVKILNIAWHYFKTQGYGQIVGVTSTASARGNKNVPSYHATKAFQSIYLEGLRVKAKHEKNNISITELIPGYLKTDMAKGNRLFWVINPTKAAILSKKAIDQKKARAFIPRRWWAIYHIQRLLPIFLYDFIINGSWKFNTKS